MSKNTVVKAAAQGGDDAPSGGGIPGAWTELTAGHITVTSGSEFILAQVATPAIGGILVAFVSGDGNTNLRFFQGNTGAPAPSGACVYSLKEAGAMTQLIARTLSTTPTVSFVLYMLIP